MQSFSIKEMLKDVPTGIKVFATKALILVAAWLLLYYLVFKPTGVPDKWLSRTTANVTARVLTVFYSNNFTVLERADYEGGTKEIVQGICLNGHEVLHLNDGCNALDLFFLYIAFLVCLHTSRKRVVLFTIAGIAIIFILNIARCCALVWLQINERRWFDFAHHYLFTLIVYVFIFWGWVLYAKKYNGIKE